MILKNHGILTAGESVESAAWRYLALENACRVQLLAEAGSNYEPMPADVARHTHSQVASEMAGRCSFEPYWNLIVQEEPDVLE